MNIALSPQSLPRATYDPAKGRRTVFQGLIDARVKHGGGKVIIEDHQRQALTYTGLIRAAFALGRKIASLTAPGEHVGVMLPSSVGGAVTFFALHAFGRVPVMLNFTSGLRNLKGAVHASGVKTILTSKRFIAQARLEELAEDLEDVAHLVWLEDVRRTIGPLDKAFALAAGAFPRQFMAKGKPEDIGVVLFTSGSFGAPKPVMLTHANLTANVAQTFGHIRFDPDWVFFNPLPIFHCFGLTGGTLLPILEGIRSFQYPSPLHYKTIPPLIRETGASVLLSTDTFMNQYARAAETDDLSSLKFVACGAERVRPETTRLLREKFGVLLIEGYGVTEASPVVALNDPEEDYPGTVGRLLPGVEGKLVPVPGIKRGGALHLRGPNIMAGYLDSEGVLQAPPNGWHDTGDICEFDDNGCIVILGRAKRFAKVAGEMVSLAAVEEMITNLWPTHRHAVVAVSDPKKGERLILVTDFKDADAGAILAHAKATDAPEIAVPRKVVRLDELPVLGTGKTDYVSIQHIAAAEVAGDGLRKRARG